MGISLLSSYSGAQIFEAIGIGSDLLNLGFYGTASRLGGLTVADLAQEVLSFHCRAFPDLAGKKLEKLWLCPVPSRRRVPHEQPGDVQASAQSGG